MLRALRPVGEAIVIRNSVKSIDNVWPLADGWHRRFYASGTDALAKACCIAAERRGVIKPEIIVPAYTCPSVISAVEYSGATPILVDFEPNRPVISLDSLGACLTRSTVAVIAVNFLGIPERIASLKTAISDRDTLIIYDHCQGLPASSAEGSQADMLVFSFGRGKPSSALGGGALLLKSRCPDMLYPAFPIENRKHTPIIGVVLHNLLIHPRLYWIPKALPFLKLGETRYKPLAKIMGLDQIGASRITANIDSSLRRASVIESEIRQMLGIFPQVIDLSTVNGYQDTSLLRYPILMPSNHTRDAAVRASDRASLGATSFYKEPLNLLPDLADRFSTSKRIPNALDFARRLLTLPCHSSVTLPDVINISKVIESSFRDSA